MPIVWIEFSDDVQRVVGRHRVHLRQALAARVVGAGDAHVVVADVLLRWRPASRFVEEFTGA